MRHVRLVIEGRVQGVAYRHWTQRRAEALGLGGWVRNRRDGTVEAMFSGDRDAVSRMIEACREGPRSAEVSAIKIVLEDEEPEFGFSIRNTV